MVETQGPFSTAAWHRVEDSRAVQVLASAEQLKYFRPFLGRTLSASKAARAAQVRLDTMMYQIERLITLGLLERVELESSSKRPVKHYRSVADRFILPFKAIDADTLLGLFLQHDGPRREAFGRGLIQSVVGEEGGWHVRVYRHSSGSIDWEAAPDHDPSWRQENLLCPHSPAAWYTNASVTLTEERAKALQMDLVRLYMAYAEPSETPSATKNQRRYTLQLALAELPPVEVQPAK